MQYLTKGSIPKHVVRMAMPIAMGMFLQQQHGFVLACQDGYNLDDHRWVSNAPLQVQLTPFSKVPSSRHEEDL